VAALGLMRHLGVCYKTAWLIKHKLMEVMRVRAGGKAGGASEKKVPATVISDGLWCFGAVQIVGAARARGHRRRQGKHEAGAIQGDQHLAGQPQALPERANRGDAQTHSVDSQSCSLHSKPFSKRRRSSACLPTAKRSTKRRSVR
jgi:hypothetical protein